MSFFLLFAKLTKSSLNLIDPSVGLSIKDIKLSNVDFPDPDGPINAYIFPLLKLYDRFFKTLIFFSVLKCLEIFFNFKGDLISQNWTGAGFLYKLNNAVKFKAGYFYQKLQNIGFNRLQLGIILNTNHRKKTK